MGGCNRAQALDVFVQPAQGSPLSKPRATTDFQTHSLALAPSPHPSSSQPLCPVKCKGSPVPAGNFPHGRCFVQFSLLKPQPLTQDQAGPEHRERQCRRPRDRKGSKHIQSPGSPHIPWTSVSSKLFLLTLPMSCAAWAALCYHRTVLNQ